jgi:hypothetical protein
MPSIFKSHTKVEFPPKKPIQVVPLRGPISATSKFIAAPMAAKGADFQAIGFTKGGRNSKIHAIVEKQCRPWLLIITPGNMADGLMSTEPALLGKRR